MLILKNSSIKNKGLFEWLDIVIFREMSTNFIGFVAFYNFRDKDAETRNVANTQNTFYDDGQKQLKHI